jgi:DNA mismatch repair ATPase MutS
MNIDQTTYNDLSIFHSEEEFSVFHKLNFTETVEGRDWLWTFFSNPFSDRKQIEETQQIIRSILEQNADWPTSISNGTLMVIDKFYEGNIDSMPDSASYLNALTYKVLHSPDFSLVKYSLTHFADFFRGMRQLIDLLNHDEAPMMIRTYLQRAAELMKRPSYRSII